MKELTISNRSWTKYAAAGIAATFAGAQSAEADITRIEVGSPDGDLISNGDSVSISFSGVALQFNRQGTSIGEVFGSLSGGSIAGFANGAFAYVSNLATTVQVSALTEFLAGSGTLVYGSGNSNSQFVNTGGFVAFRFDNDNNGIFQYGWARLSLVAGTPTNQFVLEELAFTNTEGTAIRVGQISAIPEPGGLGLLALGAAGVLANRRRKK